jgi:hypothetical protein
VNDLNKRATEGNREHTGRFLRFLLRKGTGGL